MDTRKTARIGFIGAGGHATESLYPNIPLIPEFELAAVCDIDLERAQRTARSYGAQAFSDVETMLDQAALDGCCVCGPAEMHHAVSLQVLRRGLRLFVEKPPAPGLRQAEELAETAARHNTWGMVGFMKRFAPANLLAREFMASDAFGTLSSISLIHGCGPYDDLRRMLYFNGIHLIDLGRFLGGEVERVFAYPSNGGKGNYGLSAAWQLRNGAVAQLNQNSGQTWHDCFEAVYISGAQAGIFPSISAAPRPGSSWTPRARSKSCTMAPSSPPAPACNYTAFEQSTASRATWPDGLPAVTTSAATGASSAALRGPAWGWNRPHPTCTMASKVSA